MSTSSLVPATMDAPVEEAQQHKPFVLNVVKMNESRESGDRAVAGICATYVAHAYLVLGSVVNELRDIIAQNPKVVDGASLVNWKDVCQRVNSVTSSIRSAMGKNSGVEMSNMLIELAKGSYVSLIPLKDNFDYCERYAQLCTDSSMCIPFDFKVADRVSRKSGLYRISQAGGGMKTELLYQDKTSKGISPCEVIPGMLLLTQRCKSLQEFAGKNIALQPIISILTQLSSVSPSSGFPPVSNIVMSRLWGLFSLSMYTILHNSNLYFDTIVSNITPVYREKTKDGKYLYEHVENAFIYYHSLFSLEFDRIVNSGKLPDDLQSKLNASGMQDWSKLVPTDAMPRLLEMIQPVTGLLDTFMKH